MVPPKSKIWCFDQHSDFPPILNSQCWNKLYCYIFHCRKCALVLRIHARFFSRRSVKSDRIWHKHWSDEIEQQMCANEIHSNQSEHTFKSNNSLVEMCCCKFYVQQQATSSNPILHYFSNILDYSICSTYYYKSTSPEVQMIWIIDETACLTGLCVWYFRCHAVLGGQKVTCTKS